MLVNIKMVRTKLHFGIMGDCDKVRGEAPMERRVKRWAFCLSELLSDETGVYEFEMFLEGEFSTENLRFWLEVEQLRRVPESRVHTQVDAIYTEFIASGASHEINIDSKTMEETLHSLKEPSRYTFDAAQHHIFLLMKKDSYQRYLRSEQYKNLLTNDSNSCQKKKFTFAYFGSRKRSPCPSPKSKRRGSAGSTVILEEAAPCSTTFSHHSYSTGNLKQLDGKPSPPGSNSDIKGMTKNESDKSLSPSSIRKRISDLIKGHDRHRKHSINLEVPQQFAGFSSPESSDNECDFRITVPKKPSSRRGPIRNQTQPNEINVVAPWETSDI